MRLHGRLILAAGLFFAPTVPALAESLQDQQALVDRATLAAQEVLDDNQGHDARAMLPQARAVMICPRVFKAGFLFGGEGGGCVLLARGGQGSWSSPAFYSVGGGSFGLQAGIQDAEVMMLILTTNGLRSVMDSQFRLGGQRLGGCGDRWRRRGGGDDDQPQRRYRGLCPHPRAVCGRVAAR